MQAASFFAPPDIPSVLGSRRPGCGLLGRRLRGVGEREAGPRQPRGPDGREVARRARSAPTHTVPRHPGDVAASQPLAWEPRVVRRTRGSGWRSPKAASYPAGPLPSAVRPRRGPGAAGHSIRPLAAPGHAGRGRLRRGMSCPQQHWAPPEVTPESGAGLGTREASGLGEE